MHSLHLHSYSLKFCRQLTSLLSKNVKPNSRAFCSVKLPQDLDPANDEQFRAAFLHPKKKNLSVEPLTLRKKITDGQVRIGIDYCALNSFDMRCIRGEVDSITPPFIPGSEFSGEILELGPNCNKFKVGDKVAVLSNSKLIGGGLAHQCIVSETECIRIDARLSTEQATTVIQGYSNALLAFSKYMPLKKGDDIIVCAGPGGDGLAAIEVADKIFEANVYVLYTATSVNALLCGDYKAFDIKKGFEKIYDFFKKELRAKTFKGVYDCHDSKLLHVVADFISPNGKFLTNDPLFDLDTYVTPYLKKNTGKKVGKKATVEDIEAPENIDWAAKAKKVDVTKYQITDPKFYENTVNQVFDWYASEKIQPYTGQIVKLKDVSKAMEYMRSRKSLEKVLVET